MHSPEIAQGRELLLVIHENPDSDIAELAEESWLTEDIVKLSIECWLLTGVLYSDEDRVYLTEKGRDSIGLYIRKAS